jgi:hypothetical protein
MQYTYNYYKNKLGDTPYLTNKIVEFEAVVKMFEELI